MSRVRAVYNISKGTKGDGGDKFGRAIRLIASVPVAALLLPRIAECRVLPLLSRDALHDPLALPRRPGRVPSRCARARAGAHGPVRAVRHRGVVPTRPGSAGAPG